MDFFWKGLGGISGKIGVVRGVSLGFRAWRRVMRRRGKYF